MHHHQPTINRRLLAVLFLCITFAGSALAEFTDPVLLKMVDPLFPLELPMEGMVEGKVHAAIDISEEGTVEDWMPFTATHMRFVDEIDRVIRDWKFKPAMDDGEPVPCQMTYMINFSYSDVVQVTGVQVPFFNMPSRFDLRKKIVYELSVLDALPQPVHIVRPYRKPDDTEGEWVGTVTFRFFIDKEGKVRMPVMTELEGNRNIALSANAALAQWRFEPPTIHGVPVVAKAEQVFHYHPETE